MLLIKIFIPLVNNFLLPVSNRLFDYANIGIMFNTAKRVLKINFRFFSAPEDVAKPTNSASSGATVRTLFKASASAGLILPLMRTL